MGLYRGIISSFYRSANFSGHGGSGEGQAWVVFFLDFPLVMFLKVIPHGNTFLYGPVSSYIFFFSILGTFLYAIIGGGIGFFLEKIERQPRNARNQTKQ